MIKYILIFIVLFAICGILKTIINKQKLSIKLDEMIQYLLEKQFEVFDISNENYNYIVKKNNTELYVKTVCVTNSCSLTFNSKDTVCYRFGRRKQGKEYPQSTYLNDLKPFLNMKINKDGIKCKKILVIYPKADIILKYQNESEIIEVKPLDVIYDYQVMNIEDFKNNINEIIK